MTLDKPKIAIVDDDAMVAGSLRSMLERANYEVTKVDSPERMLEMLTHEHFDAIVSDVSMPSMTGLEMLSRMRMTHNDLPVVFITGAPRLEDTMRAMELGAFRYLAKPLNREHLLRVLDEAIKWGRLLRITAGPSRESREALERSFTSALSGLYLDYQPIVDTQSGEVIGYEALLRSREPVMNNPGLVLDAAEKLGRLHTLGRQVRGTVAECAYRKRRSEVFFVNLHPADLADPQLYEADSPLNAHAHTIILELTERASLEGIDDVDKRLAALRERGYRIAVDDLGAGYAGLSYFARVSPDIVKIDMSLTRNLDADPVRRQIVASMVNLARGLSMLVVAEGIETERELQVVKDLGVDLVQGYLLGRPAPYPDW